MNPAIAEKITGRVVATFEDAELPMAQGEQGEETAIFYHWIGSGPGGTVIYISGGQRVVSGDGQVMHKPLKQAEFHNGMFATSDPEIIAMLRGKYGKPGSGVTEDKDEYYQHVMSKEMLLRRQAAQNIGLQEDNVKLKEENSRLVAQLAAAGAKKKAE